MTLILILINVIYVYILKVIKCLEKRRKKISSLSLQKQDARIVFKNFDGYFSMKHDSYLHLFPLLIPMRISRLEHLSPLGPSLTRPPSGLAEPTCDYRHS